jgi:hypothetical protein
MPLESVDIPGELFGLRFEAARDLFRVFRGREVLRDNPALAQQSTDVGVVAAMFGGYRGFSSQVIALDIEVGDFVDEIFGFVMVGRKSARGQPLGTLRRSFMSSVESPPKSAASPLL